MLPILDKGSKVRYSRSLKKHINKLRPLKGGEWDFDDEEISNIKKLIRVQLMKHQDAKCAYCGLAFDGTSRAEIEHIAPKGGKKRPKYTTFTFTPYNLVLSCHLCNSPVKKEVKILFLYLMLITRNVNLKFTIHILIIPVITSSG